MDDARQPQPVCGDEYAKIFMDEHGRHIYDMFKAEINCNASMLVRHRIIDDMVRQHLVSNPDLCIITIGAGLDSRPYRLVGGRWYELDEPAVVAHKNKRLPSAKCPNQLERIAINFSTDALQDKLAPMATEDPVVIIMEGVFIYLDEDDIRKTIAPFHRLFPGHRLICDLVNREMVEKYGRTLHEKIEGIGTQFKPVNYPDKVFTTNGYRINDRISVVERSTDFSINKFPKWMLKCFFFNDVFGNSVYEFESHELYGDLII
ncbi:MAG: class I SAM-dependent methyltransferase [Burkholderiaceae bacterium]